MKLHICNLSCINLFGFRKRVFLKIFSAIMIRSNSGHGMFNEYRHRFKLAEDPSCPECGAEIESPEHILFQCSAYDQLQQTHLHPNKIATKDDLPKLKTRKAASAFAEFCKAAIRHKIQLSFASPLTDR